VQRRGQQARVRTAELKVPDPRRERMRQSLELRSASGAEEMGTCFMGSPTTLT